MTSQFTDMTPSSNIFHVVLFLLSGLVTGPSFISISLLVLELWQFSFIRIDQKSGNRKYPCLSLQLLPFLSSSGKTSRGGGGKIIPPLPHTQIRVKTLLQWKIFRKKNSDPPLWKFDSFQSTSVENMEQKTIVKFMAFSKLF